MSMPTLVNLNAPAAPVSTGSNALKALHAAGSGSAGEGSAEAVHFTLDEAGESTAVADMSTPVNSVAKGSHPSGSTTNPKIKSSAATSTAGTDATLLSMLQAIAAVPATAVAPAASPVPSPTATGGEGGAAASGSDNPATPVAATGSGNAPATSTSAANLQVSADAAIDGLPALVQDPTAALPLSSQANDAAVNPKTTAPQAGSVSVSVSTLLSLQAAAKATPAPIAEAIAVAAKPTQQQSGQAGAASNPVPGSGTPQAPAPLAAATPAAIVDPAADAADPVPAETQLQPASRPSVTKSTMAVATPVSPAQTAAPRSSSLLTVLAQTITDVAAAASDTAATTAQPMPSMSTAFSSLLQQIADGGARSGASSGTLAQGPTVADVQLAAAASPAAGSMLPATAASDLGTSANANVVSPSTAAPIDTTRQDWPDALGSRVDWMLHQGLQEARIELHPRDMGSINVHIKLGNDGADVRFAATNPNVRDALESSLPKLRELLAGGGLQLAQAQVGSQMQQQESSGRFLPQQAPAQSTPVSAAVVTPDQQPQADVPRVRVASVSIIDDYA